MPNAIDERRGGRAADPIAHRFRRLDKQLADRDAVRVAGARPQRHQHQQRHQNGARPVRDLGDVKRRPARQQHDLDRHYRNRPPRHLAEQREQDAGEDVAAPRAAVRQDRRPRPRHMRRIERIPGRLQREIRFDRRADVESAAVEQRPAAVLALGRSNVSRDARLQLGLDPAEIVLQQNELGRDRHIRLELENPMSVGMLERDQRLAGPRDRLVEPRTRDIGS